jgi:signal transduction histidine kinase
VLSALSARYLFMEPRGSLSLESFADQIWFALFLTQGALVSALAESRLRVLTRIEEFSHVLERRVRDRTAELLANNQRLESEIATRRMVEAERSRLLAVAEEANRLKDEFLATLSHELRTPLSAIVGWAGLLDEGGLEPAEVKHALGVIKRNAAAQTQLIADLLDVSAIVAGKLHLAVGRVDLRSVIQAALDSIGIAAENKGIAIHVGGDERVTCIGDANRLRQVAWNLLSNAVKFTPKGGRIEVTLKRSGEEVEISVRDTGEGIPAAFLPHVFDRFRQANNSITRFHGGLGLGLAIVRHLVELHGGAVEARSEGEGKGATFVLHLPSTSRSEEAAGESLPVAADQVGAAEPWLGGVRVLVVDDEADTLDLVARALRRRGAEVFVANSVAQALEALHDLHPCVLLSDLGMPGEDGYSLIRRVRNLSDEEGGKVRAAALTAYAGEQVLLRILAAGYERHVSKPVAMPELVGVVAELAGRT